MKNSNIFVGQCVPKSKNPTKDAVFDHPGPNCLEQIPTTLTLIIEQGKGSGDQGRTGAGHLRTQLVVVGTRERGEDNVRELGGSENMARWIGDLDQDLRT